jgi:hypothetical protein
MLIGSENFRAYSRKMLQIRPEQFAVLENAARRAFHDDLYQRLSTKLCSEIESLGREGTLNRMLVWHERGIELGLLSERAVGRFLGIHLTIRPDFDLHEEVRQFLIRSDMTGDQKMTALYTRLRAKGKGI